tara:strand:- start:114 stop:1139 length:1026 start_codon:yes stop_codon:yes gene_type:complete
MKVLIVGEWHSLIHEEQLFHSFKTKGIDVYKFKTYKYFHSDIKFLRKILKGCDKYSLRFSIKNINRDLIDYAQKIQPDLLFFYRPRHILETTILKIKQIGRVKIFIYNNDSPFGKKYPKYFWRRYLKIINYADKIFSYRPSDQLNYKKLFIDSELLMPWFDSGDLKKIIKKKFSERKDQLLFIGHAEDDLRIPILNTVLDNLNLFGPTKDWSRKYVSHKLKNLVKPTIWGEDYYKTLADHKIALCFLSKINNDVYTRRCFEIPASGTMLFSEYSKELDDIFKDMKGAVFFKDLEEFHLKFEYLKANPEIIENIAKVGEQIVLGNKFDVSSRVEFIIKNNSN